MFNSELNVPVNNINYKKNCNFDIAVNYVLDNEDGLNIDNVEHDEGGLTNHGISLRFLKQLTPSKLRTYGIWDPEVTDQTIKDLTIAQAKLIYKGEFWSPIYEKMINYQLCNYIFDMAVNLSPAIAHRIVQRALWAVDPDLRITIIEDGIFGEITLKAVNARSYFNAALRTALIAERAAYYRFIVDKNPKQKIFLDGWLNRTYRIS